MAEAHPNAGPQARNATATLLTVDVECDWAGTARHGVREVLPRLLELLGACGARATLFTVGQLAEELVRHVAPDGPHEVGSHGLTHRRLDRLGADEVRVELAESKRRLEACGYRVDGFRAPFLRTPADVGSLLAALGYRYDASGGSVFPSWRNGRVLCDGRNGRNAREHGAHGERAADGGAPDRRERRDARNGRHAHDGAGRDARAAAPGALPRLGTSTLRGGLVPFNLTWLRLLHPLGRRLVAPDAQHLSLHLHELLDADPRIGLRPGWAGLPAPLRRLHGRHCGEVAWQLLEELLRDPARRFTTCREHLRLARDASAADRR